MPVIVHGQYDRCRQRVAGADVVVVENEPGLNRMSIKVGNPVADAGQESQCHNQRQLTRKSPHEALTTCGDTSEAAVRPANPMANATSVPITMNQGQPRSLP